MIKLIVLSVLLSISLRGESLSSKSYDTEIVKMCIIEYTMEIWKPDLHPSRKRGGKGNKKRRRGGNGLR